MYARLLIATGALILLTVPTAAAESRPIRFLLHGNMSHELPTEEYLRFVEQIKPDILVMGVFDQRLYAQPEPEKLLARWKIVAERLHKSGIRLVGQMEMNVVSDRPADQAEGK